MRDRPETMAGRWAAKEAVSKVLGLGVRGIGWRDIEIERLPTGQPAVRLHGRAAARAEQLGMGRIAVSISHESDYAVAIAFGVRTAGGRFLFPPDIEERLDDRERRILARIERLRDQRRGERRRGARLGRAGARPDRRRPVPERRGLGFGRRDRQRDRSPASDADERPWPEGARGSTTRSPPAAAPGAADARPQGLVRQAARHRRLARLRRAPRCWSAGPPAGAGSGS